MKLGGTVLNGLVRQIERDPESVAGRSVWPRFIKAPDTRFNHQISANRVFEAVSLPMGPMKAMRRTIEGSTINDIFLSVLGGALHHYLKSKQELPEKSMTALMPISVRDASQPAALGNQVGGAPVKMHSEIADPLKRLEAVHIDTTAAKAGSEALGNNLLKDIMDGMPHTVTDQFLRYGVFSQLNATASNLRGPNVPLYVAGARLEQFYPVSIVMDHVGLNHTAFSYNGTMWIGVVACRNMMPDPGFYADCLRRSFSELVEAAEARAGSGGTPVRSTKASARRGSKPAPRLKKLARKKKPAKRPAA
jgi:WS/DGAT/MGAT family acyltransferase